MRGRDPRSGFSLVELGAVLLLTGVVTASLCGVVATMMRTDGAAVEQAGDGAATAAALESLRRDLRLVTEFELLREGFVRARVDGRTVSWRLEGGRVLRNEGGRDRALGRNVSGFSVESRGRLATVRLRGDARGDGLVPAWTASATVARRLEGER